MNAFGVTAAAVTASFGTLCARAAVLRARAIGDRLGSLLALGLILGTTAICAGWEHASIGRSLALAYLAVCGWTDLRARHVYLPVSALAAIALAGAAVGAGSWAPSALGALGCGAFGLVLHLATRRRGFGLGDVANWSLLGAGFGWYPALWAIGIGSTLGAVVVVVLIALGVLARSSPIPMASLTFVGALVVEVGAIGGPG